MKTATLETLKDARRIDDGQLATVTGGWTFANSTVSYVFNGTVAGFIAGTNAVPESFGLPGW